VREPAEYSENTIPTSLNIPITSNPDALLLTPEDFLDRFGFEKPPLDKQMVFFCKAGVRSSAAAAIAKQGGYQHVGEYRGSWLDWMKKGGLGTKGGPSGSEAKTGARDAWDHGIKGGEQGLKGGKKEAGEVDSGFNTGETGKGSQEYVPPGGWAEGTNQDPKKTTSGQ
jgi:rhodanese-related sulfurtransferase